MSLIYDLAIVEDRGDYWEVTGITSKSFDYIVNNSEKYLNLSSAAAKMIKDSINENKKIKINKNLITNEVLPGELNIIDENINSLQYKKDAIFIKIKMIVTPEMTKESGFTLYNFIMANNELNSKGFFIFDGNREEKYIEIIETGDEDLINLLETFLESKDLLERAASFKTRLDQFKKDIQKCQNEDEINKLEETFLTRFYKAF